MITKKIKIQLKNGLEARPVAVLVQVASQYDSRIDGDDETNAMDEIEKYLSAAQA